MIEKTSRFYEVFLDDGKIRKERQPASQILKLRLAADTGKQLLPHRPNENGPSLGYEFGPHNNNCLLAGT